MPESELIRRLTTDRQKPLWKPFVRAVREYGLISPGDRIAVCVSGGKDSMLLALLLTQYRNIGEVPFDLTYLTLDPGYSPENRARIHENAARLGLPLTEFSVPILRVADRQDKHPCFLCARMRRGHLYARAQELGCNKIALGHHYNDVIETTLMGMLYGGQLQGMLPMRQSDHYPGMCLIRPLYRVREADIIDWAAAEGLSFLRCGCRFASVQENTPEQSRRATVKALIATLEAEHPGVENSIFRSIHTVQLDSLVRYKQDGVWHSDLLPPSR